MENIHETEAKSHKVNIRISHNLKKRYEDALKHAGITMTQHLTIKIHEFINQEEKRMGRKQEEPKIESSSQ